MFCLTSVRGEDTYLDTAIAQADSEIVSYCKKGNSSSNVLKPINKKQILNVYIDGICH